MSLQVQDHRSSRSGALLRDSSVTILAHSAGAAAHRILQAGKRVAPQLTDTEPRSAPIACSLEQRTSISCSDVPSAAAAVHERDLASLRVQVLICNLRLDNADELTRSLGMRSENRPSHCELFARAYQTWGKGCVNRIMGGYFVVLWNGLRRELVAIRDPMGQRLGYFYQGSDWLGLSSSPIDLIGVGADPQINPDPLEGFLLDDITAGGSYFSSIHLLPAGSKLTAHGPNHMTIDQVWPDHDHLAEMRREFAPSGFEDLFRLCTRSKLGNEHTVGAMTSGGLDSISVTAAAASELLRFPGRNVHAFTSVAPGMNKYYTSMDHDESPIVEQLSSSYPNIHPHKITNDGRFCLANTESLFDTSFAPLRNVTNLPWLDQIVETCDSLGIRLLLDGACGNMTISYWGERLLYTLMRSGNLARMWSQAARSHDPNGIDEESRVRRILRETTQGMEHLGYLHSLRIRMQLKKELRPPHLQARWLESQRVRKREVNSRKATPGDDPTFRIELIKRYVLPYAGTFEAYCKSTFNIELVDPTADLRVVEYCLSAPPEAFRWNGRDRLLVRDGLAKLLPESIRERRAVGSQAPDWLMNLAPYRAEMHDVISAIAKSAYATELLNVKGLRYLVDTLPSEPPFGYDPQFERHYNYGLTRGLMAGLFILWFERIGSV